MNKTVVGRVWAGCVAAALVLGAFASWASSARAEWVWTKETGWINTDTVVRRTVDEIYTDAQKSFEAKDYEKAFLDFRLLAVYLPESKYSEEALYLASESLYFLGRYNAAWGYYKAYLDVYPGSKRTTDIIARLHEVGKAFLAGRKVDIELPYGFRFALWPDRSKGIKILNDIVDHYPYAKNSDEVQMTVADYYFQVGEFEKSILQYTKVLSLYHTGEAREYAMFRVGECYYAWHRSKKYTAEMLPKATEAFGEYLRSYEKGRFVDLAKEFLQKTDERQAEKDFYTADFYQRTGSPQGAYVYFKNIAKKYPATSFAEPAAKRAEALEPRVTALREKNKPETKEAQ